MAGDMRTLLYDAGCIDPATDKENTDERKRRTARQKELAKWFADRGQSVSYSRNASEEDKRNYLEFRDAMSTAEFLDRTPTKRKAFIRKTMPYFDDLASFFPVSLESFIGADNSAAGQRVRAVFAMHCSEPVIFKTRYFGRRTHTAIGALYFPPTKHMYLNLNYLVYSPSSFVDSFEHELWHHLLVRPSVANLGDNLWWEGFTEVAAVLWHDELEKHSRAARNLGGRGVEYDIQAAVASLYYVVDRVGTIDYLAGGTTAEAFAERLTGGAGHPVLRRHLGPWLVDRNLMPPDRKARVEKLITTWGWTENDKSPAKIDEFIKDGQLDREMISKGFRHKKDYLLDIIDAMTVVWLQDLQQDIKAKDLLKSINLPEQLEDNLDDVLSFARGPAYHYSTK
jgi:hypothetical protein